MVRHFTASAVILQGDQVLLIWHRQLGWWLQPGGHIEADEDPVQAVRREVREEVGLEIDLLGPASFEHHQVGVVPPPFTILIEDVTDHRVGPHQHIDMIYVGRPRDDGAVGPGDVGPGAEYTGPDQARWVAVGQVAELDTAPELPDLVAAAHTWATTYPPTVSAQRGCPGKPR